jgi:hypothetical protein
MVGMLIVVLIVLLWEGPKRKCARKAAEEKKPEEKNAVSTSPAPPRVNFIREDTVPMGTTILPPIQTYVPRSNGPTKTPVISTNERGEDPKAPTIAESTLAATLPSGGLSCANKRWYDSIYNGGVATAISLPGDSKRDMDLLWRHDYDGQGYNGTWHPQDVRESRAFTEPPVYKNMFV